jgi:hypothetical protein
VRGSGAGGFWPVHASRRPPDDFSNRADAPVHDDKYFLHYIDRRGRIAEQLAELSRRPHLQRFHWPARTPPPQRPCSSSSARGGGSAECTTITVFNVNTETVMMIGAWDNDSRDFPPSIITYRDEFWNPLSLKPLTK